MMYLLHLCILLKIRDLINLPSPMSISIWWNGGSILGMLLVLQILTGFFLSMHYTSDISNTFFSIVHIMRDVPMGWEFRFLHANGASFFFLFIYFHIGRGLYYQSYLTQPRTWMVGVTIFLVSMATAFLGYVLPWGQMSFWGATVITNLMSAIPYFGPSLVEWIWGSFSVGQPTLTRFFSLHFILPFLIVVLSAVHLIFLHEKGSSNPLGDLNHSGKIPFNPYFTWKDFVGFILVFFFVCFIVFFFPNVLGDPENFSMANFKVTPTHIQPEWYFLFAYAILRSIPSKLGGVIALAMSIFILYFLPVGMFKYSFSGSFCFVFQLIYWILISMFILLTWLGACPIEEPYMTLAVPCTFLYFFLFVLLIIIPIFWKKIV
uniref:Cytochrome b n=1 Tax=Biomphalaria pfeifferi TaxID=112525 RepID=A0A2U8J9F2_BIOPF|nr:cytochrome b [Biomphalaria pfeifferi]AWK49460.1 cytochrome b [Biomphalaria pfeifferi]